MLSFAASTFCVFATVLASFAEAANSNWFGTQGATPDSNTAVGRPHRIMDDPVNGVVYWTSTEGHLFKKAGGP